MSSFLGVQAVIESKACCQPLYRPGQPLLADAQGGGQGRSPTAHPIPSGARATRHRAHRGLFTASTRSFRAHLQDLAGALAPGARAGRNHRHRGGQRLHPRGLSAGPQRPLRGRAGRRRLGLHAHSRRRSRRDPVRRGGAAGRPRQLRLLPHARNCRSPKARCGPISSRRGSRCTSIPTARTPSSTGPAASAATTRKAGSRTTAPSSAPLKSARRRACGRHGQASGLTTAHRRTKAEEADN